MKGEETMLAKVETKCVVLGGLAASMKDHGQTAVVEVLRGRHIPMDIHEASGRAERLAMWSTKVLLPDVLSRCGIPEEIIGELHLVGQEALDDVAEILNDVHSEVVDIDPSAADYNAYRALMDAKWAVERVAQAVNAALDGRDARDEHRIADAAELFDESARNIGAMVVNETAPQVTAVVSWVLEEVA